MFRTICYTIGVAAACLLTAVSGIADQGGKAPVDYRLDLRLDPNRHRIEGTVTLAFPSPATVATLRLAPQAEVRSIRADGREIAYVLRGDRLELSNSPRNQIKQLQIDYRAVFNDPLPRDTVGVEDPSFGVSATILPEGVFLAEGTPWFPQRIDARGRHRVRITAPEGMLAVTAGRFLGSRTADGLTITEWENDFPMQGLALAAGHYEVARDELDGIQLLTFLSAGNAGLAPGYLAAMRRHLDYYRNLLGPYPFAKFAVVENFLPTGYGLPSWTLLGKSVVRLPFILETSLPHEIVHSWWGNAIEVDYAHGNWAEGLTTYLADYQLKEPGQPAEALAYRRKILRDYAALVTVQNDFPLRDFSGRMARYQQAIGYGKGAMIFHMLRRQIGDGPFHEGLRQLAGSGVGRRLGWPDLEQTFSRVAGQDLRWFFAQWVEQPGAPELTMEGVRGERSGAGWLVSGTIRQKGRPYRLGLPMQLTFAGGETVSMTIALAGERTPFQLTAAGRPERLEADPAVELFRRLAPEELPPTINDLTTPQAPLVVVADGQRPLLDAARTLLKGLRWDAAEIIDEADLDPAATDNRDLLLLGWPRRPELRPALPEGLEIIAGSLPSWRFTGTQQAGDVLFAVTARRQERHGTRAVFLANSPGSAREVAAKISHYGRYSLLLFEAGRNLVKSTWDPDKSPLTFVFPKEF